MPNHVPYNNIRIESYEEACMLVAEWQACHPDCTVQVPMIEMVRGGSGWTVDFSFY